MNDYEWIEGFLCGLLSGLIGSVGSILVLGLYV